jgi:hypothetical protein
VELNGQIHAPAALSGSVKIRLQDKDSKIVQNVGKETQRHRESQRLLLYAHRNAQAFYVFQDYRKEVQAHYRVEWTGLTCILYRSHEIYSTAARQEVSLLQIYEATSPGEHLQSAWFNIFRPATVLECVQVSLVTGQEVGAFEDDDLICSLLLFTLTEAAWDRYQDI